MVMVTVTAAMIVVVMTVLMVVVMIMMVVRAMVFGLEMVMTGGFRGGSDAGCWGWGGIYDDEGVGATSKDVSCMHCNGEVRKMSSGLRAEPRLSRTHLHQYNTVQYNFIVSV